MFGTSMKKAMVVATVAAVSALAPAVASAEVWSVDGANPFTGTAHVGGTLTFSLLAPGTPHETCEVSATVDLDNNGPNPGTGQGSVSQFNLSNCTSTAPNCALTPLVDTTTPLPITTVGTTVRISGISLTKTYAGAGCSVNGVVMFGWGALEAPLGGNVLTFQNAPGLTFTWGPAVVNGQVEVVAVDGNGDPDYNAPVELV